VRCLSKDDALELVAATLTDLGETGFGVRTDGPFSVPLAREKEVLEHYEAGCWMYSTVGWFDGQAVFFVSGKESYPAIPTDS
jgi:trehalose utilization protein